MSTDTRQEPLDTINAEITDAFEDLGGPSISETAQGRDHYTRQGQLDQIVDARESDIRFMNLVLSVCALPRRSMGHQRQYVRRTGDYMLAFNATDPDYGLPYGVYPRLLFAWICTEAVRTKTPRLVLGRSLNEFLTTLGIKSSNSPSLPRLAVVLRIWAVFGECEACNLLIIKDRVLPETNVVP